MAIVRKRILAVCLCAAVMLLAGCVTPALTTPTPESTAESTASPAPTSTDLPTLQPRDLTEFLPTSNTNPLPDGVIAQLGIGSISAGISPDSRYFIIRSSAGVMAYDFNTAEPLWDQTKPGYEWVWLLDGENIRIDWDIYAIRTGELIQSSQLPYLYPVVWSPDGKLAATSAAPATIVLYDAVKGVEVARLEPPESLEQLPNDVPSYQLDMAFSPDGAYIAAAYAWFVTDGYNGEASVMGVWDVQSGNLVSTLSPINAFFNYEWSPNSKWLTSYANSALSDSALWDISSGTKALVIENSSRLVWTPDGRLAAYSVRGGLQIIDGATLETKSLLPSFNGINAWYPDGSALVDLNGIILGASDGSELGRIQEEIRLLGISENRQSFASYSNSSNGFALWRFDNLSEPDARFEPSYTPARIVWSPDGTQLIGDQSPDPYESSILWDIGTKSAVAVERNPANFGADWYSLSFHPSWDRDPVLGYILDRVKANQKDLEVVVGAFDPKMNGPSFGDEGGILAFMDTLTGQSLANPIRFDEPPLFASWSPDDTKLAVGINNRNAVEIWDVSDPTNATLIMRLQTNEPLDSGEPAEYGFAQVEWSPTGDVIAGIYGFSPLWINCNMCPYGVGGKVYLWDASTGTPLDRPASGADAEVMAFSPDGQFLATAAINGIITVWETNPK